MDYNITIPEYSRDLSKHMYQLQQAGLFCDAWLVCKDGVVFVHKLVLMACGSAYLLQQLSIDTSTSTQCQVFLKGYSLKTVYDFVQALYTGSFTLNHDRAFEMLNLCTFLDVSIFTSSVQGVVNNDSNLKQEVEKRQKKDDKNCVFYEVEIAQDSFSAPLKIPIKLLEDNVIMERIGDTTFNNKSQIPQSCEEISNRNGTSISNSDYVDNNKRKNNANSSNTGSDIPQKQARVSKQSKNEVLTRPDIFSQQIKLEKEKLKIVEHVQDSQGRTIQSDHVYEHVEVHDKKGVLEKTERLSTISDLICTEVDEYSTDGTITDIDENSSEGTITELQVDKPKTLSTSKGSSEISKTLSTSMGSSEKSKTLLTNKGSSENSKTLSTSKGSSEKSKTLSTSMSSSENSKTLSTNKGSSEKSKTLSTSMSSSENSKTLSTNKGSSEKLKTLSTSMGSSENSNTLSTSMGSSENSNILSTSMGSLENSKTLSTSIGSFVKAEKQQWKCQLCQKISKDYVKKKNGQHICKGCDSLFSGEDNRTDGGENMEKEPEGKKEEKINPHDTVITGGLHGKRNKKYRPYSTSTMAAAYKAVIDDKLSIRASSKIHGVPFQTLRDRVTGNIDPECTTMGNAPLFTLDEESRLVTHLMEMGELGYGYYRQDVLDIATDYAITLDLKTKNDKPLSLAWFYGMIKRWPDLKVVKQRALEVVKANTANKENISKYFNELEKALLRNNLIDKPHLIYNVDEKSVAISGKGERVTILGCGNAIGNALPPFFIFPGQKMDDKLVEGSSPGTVGTVSKTGESNSDIFMDFLHNHFMKIVPDTGFVLLLLDGHTSHIPVGTFEWARNHNIVLQLIPAHTSHFLQPLDVGCYGLLQDIYNSLCHKTIRTKNCALDHNDVCPMVCKAYKNALSTNNLQSAFRKTGIYPFTKDVMDLPLEPSEALCLSDTANIEESQVENMIDLHFLNEDNSS